MTEPMGRVKKVDEVEPGVKVEVTGGMPGRGHDEVVKGEVVSMETREVCPSNRTEPSLVVVVTVEADTTDPKGKRHMVRTTLDHVVEKPLE